jgi:5'-3' exonuclease
MNSIEVPVIFDGDSLWARSYFAAASIDEQSQHIIGIQLAVQSVISLLSPLSNKLADTPTHLLFCWDGRVAKRDKGRAPKTPAYLEGKQLLGEILTECFGAANAYPEGEADDAVATAAKQLELLNDTKTIYIVSGDKDLQQLVSDKIAYYSLNEKSILNWTHICQKWHVKHPAQVAIALAIIGDSGDKISGVKGWGTKRVTKIFEQVVESMDLDTVYRLVESKMNPEQTRQFEESLDLTLLLTEVPNLPDPSPIVIGGRKLLEDMGWDLWRQLEVLQVTYDSSSTKAVLDEIP